MRKSLDCFLAGLSALIVVSSGIASVGKKPNVLFIAVDDLRPQILDANIDHYNTKVMKTPNLDRLAQSSVVFERAYCQIPVCGASRMSIMTGTRPFKAPGKDYGRFWDAHDHLDTESPSGAPAGMNHEVGEDGSPVVTLPGIFKANGYNTQSIGKIYHRKGDDAESWSRGVTRIKEWKVYNIEKTDAAFEVGVGMGDSDYPDGKHRDLAVDALRSLAAEDEPFFLGLGFVKPHLPFNCPESYWDLYNEEEVRLSETPLAPEGAPAESLHNWPELRHYKGLEFADEQQTVLTDEYARKLIHGYYACVSYADAMVGDVLAELDRLGIRDNTIVVLWGDHGWNLGDHSLWCKHSLYETSLQVPLIIDAPNKESGRSSALAEHVDMYPTLCELAGIELPKHLQGTSLVPLLADPDREWKGAVFSRWHAGNSVRTDRYRYSEYFSTDDVLLSRMLYDLDADPLETVNIAEEPKNRALVASLSTLLNDGWTRAVSGEGNAAVSFDVLPDGTIE